ncbi:MAG: glycosyltransferase family 39 protein [Elusimicrobia bacterium]|nr:glycosyltransferase family 39 protein [Candidatus Liberimonas magnetica]
MSKKHYAALFTILVLSLVLNLTGIKWGIPSNKNIDLIMETQGRTGDFYRLMKSTRDEVYKYSEGSPIGRYKEAGMNYSSPLYRSLNVPHDKNLLIPQADNFKANIMRPFFLRSFSGDEQMTIAALGTMHPKSLDFNPRLFQYGGVYIYGMGASLALAHIARLVTINPDITFYFKNPDEMGKIFAFSRSLNALFVLLTVIVLFLISIKYYNLNVAISAALLYILNPSVIFQAHILKPYILAALFSSLTIYYSLCILNDNSKPVYYWLSGLFTGLTIGTLVPYGIIIAAPIFAHFLSARKFNRNLIILIIFPFIVLLLTNPYWVLKFKDVCWELLSTRNVYSKKIFTIGFLELLIHRLPWGFSYSIYIAGLAGMVYAAFSKKKENVLLLMTALTALIVFLYLVQNQGVAMHNSRFFLQFALVSALLGAIFIDYLSRVKYLKFFSHVILTAVILFSLPYSMLYLKNFYLDTTSKCTRAQAGSWIKDNIPAGSIIGLHDLPQPAFTPFFKFNDYKLLLINNINDKEVLMDYFVAKNPREVLDNEYFRNNYELVKSFETADNIFGFKVTIIQSSVNSTFGIYKRIR